jgi:copper chaperone CopZ
MTQTFSISGMTCENCVRHVREALTEIPGVRSATVDLAGACATVEAETEVSRERVAAALEDAGYTLE